jgi:hypothetical protein
VGKRAFESPNTLLSTKRKSMTRSFKDKRRMGINPPGVPFSFLSQSAILFAGPQPSFLQASFGSNEPSSINDGAKLVRVSPAAYRVKTGKVDGRIYADVFVLRARPKFECVATNSIGGEPMNASLAISDGNIFIRTDKQLWCIGNETM